MTPTAPMPASETISAELRQVLRRLKLSAVTDTLPERLALATSSHLAYQEFLTIVLAGGLTLVLLRPGGTARTTIVGYFQNTNGLFRGDDVRARGRLHPELEQRTAWPRLGNSALTDADWSGWRASQVHCVNVVFWNRRRLMRCHSRPVRPL